MSWEGTYSDPKHPEGYRTITVHDGVATIKGVDSAGGAVWTVTADVLGPKAIIDFGPKGGPKISATIEDDDNIHFSDGNTWSRTS